MTARTFMLRLWRDERGLAFVEFAFAAPILLFLILGGLELVNYALAHLRVNQIAMTVADNAGRVVTGIDEANVYEVFAGAGVIGEPLDFEANGRIVLSSLQDNGRTGGAAGQMINWQRCWGELDVDPAYGTEGTGRTNDDLEDGMGRPGSRILSAPDTAVMVVEVSYDYQPLINSTLVPMGTTIRHESAFNVRGRQNNNISNTQVLAVLDCDT
jgi:Flp pilus assembly pilin Flp